MVFSSIPFLFFFLPVCFLLYYAVPFAACVIQGACAMIASHKAPVTHKARASRAATASHRASVTHKARASRAATASHRASVTHKARASRVATASHRAAVSRKAHVLRAATASHKVRVSRAMRATHVWKNGVLLLFSLIFYAWGEPVYLLLMLFATLVDYSCGRLMTRFGATAGRRRCFLICALAINLSMLAFFKYADFLIGTVNGLFGVSIQPLGLGLPVGISFFTFQTMSYSIDLYRRKVPEERNYLNYLTYVSMFPQLVAGPIVRYATVNEELHNRKIKKDEVQAGILRFMQGLFKKVLIANQIGALWEEIRLLEAGQASVATAWLGAVAFTLQLYFDFSAYSDMAIGMGWMLGFHFPENFRYPLYAVSVTDFWRRWHISLSTWFRDYIYIPLGGNRVGVAKHLRNMFVVWFLTGLWHGASWNFVLWGLYYGVLLALEKYVWGKALEALPKAVQHFYAILIVVVGFVVFVFDDMGALGAYLKSMAACAGNPWWGEECLWYLGNYGLVLAVGVILAFPVYPWVKGWLGEIGSVHAEGADGAGNVGMDDLANVGGAGKNASVLGKNGTGKGTAGAAVGRTGRSVLRIAVSCVAFVGYVALFLVSTAFLVNDTYNPFLYFRF